MQNRGIPCLRFIQNAISLISIIIVSACGGGSGGGGLPSDPPPPAYILDVSTNSYGSCAVKAPTLNHDAGNLYCWGEGWGGRFGNIVNSPLLRPTRIATMSQWRSVSLGLQATCAVADNGAIYCWGYNLNGELGFDNDTDGDNRGEASYDPTNIDAATDWAGVDIRMSTTCALKISGKLYCWGENLGGQLGIGTVDSSPSYNPAPLAVRYSAVQEAGADWLKVSTGGSASCGIKKDHSLWCWGADSLGQIGDGNNTANNLPTATWARVYPTPVVDGSDVADPGPWRDVAIGFYHTCAVKSTAADASAPGSLWCWGNNDYGQAGQDPDSADFLIRPTRVGLDNNWVSVTAGRNHSCAINSGTQMYCWGENANIQLGPNTTGNAFDPTLIGSLNNQDWLAVASGETHDCAIKNMDPAATTTPTPSAIFCWGANEGGQLGNGDIDNKLLPNRIVDNTDPDDDPNSWIQLAAGSHHNCGLRDDNSLWCWGRNQYGQLGDGNTLNRSRPVRVGSDTNWMEVDSYRSHNCAIKGNNTLWCWGRNEYGQIGDNSSNPVNDPVTSPMQEASGATNWTSLATGGSFSCATKASNNLWCWGDDFYGQVGKPRGTFPNESARAPQLMQINAVTPSWNQIAAGEEHACGLRAADAQIAVNNTLWCWGWNESSQLAVSNATAYSATPLQINRPMETNSVWSQIAPGQWHTCARATDNTVWCWGSNFDGAVGDPTQYNPVAEVIVTTPSRVDLATDRMSGIPTLWQDISAHDEVSCGITQSGSLWCWGSNNSGQMGLGNTDIFTYPEPVQEASGATNWVEVSVGDNHVCARKSDQSNWCWGNNDEGQLGDGGQFDPVPTRVSIP